MEKDGASQWETKIHMLALVNKGCSKMSSITKRKKNWPGHILRGGDLLRDVTEGRMESKRTRKRRTIGMIDDLRKALLEV